MRISLTVIVLIATLSACAQDGGEEPQPVKLTATSSKVLDVPSSSIHTMPQCDAGGNLYSHVNNGARVGAIAKIALDGPSAQYTINADDAKHLYFLAFHVTPDHRVWILTGGPKDAISVFRIEPDDASKSERISLDTPDGLAAPTVQSFVMLPKDHVLLQGYFDDKAPKEKQGHSYLAEFDSSGKLLRTSLDTATSEAIAYASKWGAQTVAYQSGDGITYLLQQDKILVLSGAGDVMRTIPLAPAQKNYHADYFYMNRGRLIVSFYGPDPQSNKPLTMRYALVDPSSGEVIRWYEPDAEVGTALVCFSDDGLIFRHDVKGHIKLVTAAIK
jgi:hypothetical protein